MMETYNQNMERFISKYGHEKFSKLYNTVRDSNASAKFAGLTINKGLPPTASDCLLTVNTIFYVASKINIAYTVMAALILLKEWNGKVNSSYRFVSDQRLEIIAEGISTKWI